MKQYTDEEIDALYEQALRFDEGELRNTQKYTDIVQSQCDIFTRLYEKYGEEILQPLYKYNEALYGEMELEAQHFFREGVRLAIKNSSSR